MTSLQDDSIGSVIQPCKEYDENKNAVRDTLKSQNWASIITDKISLGKGIQNRESKLNR